MNDQSLWNYILLETERFLHERGKADKDDVDHINNEEVDTLDGLDSTIEEEEHKTNQQKKIEARITADNDIADFQGLGGQDTADARNEQCTENIATRSEREKWRLPNNSTNTQVNIFISMENCQTRENDRSSGRTEGNKSSSSSIFLKSHFNTQNFQARNQEIVANLYFNKLWTFVQFED